jgi:hypothetical protein
MSFTSLKKCATLILAVEFLEPFYSFGLIDIRVLYMFASYLARADGLRVTICLLSRLGQRLQAIVLAEREGILPLSPRGRARARRRTCTCFLSVFSYKTMSLTSVESTFFNELFS